MKSSFEMLKDVLPEEFMSSEYNDSKARKFSEIEVIEEMDAMEYLWPGKEMNVHYWYKLANGYAVGWNENPSKGWSFPVIKLPDPLSEILSLKVKCGKCGQIVDIKFSNHDFNSSERECEICGSHGDRTYAFKCPNCEKFETIEIDSW